MLEETTLKVLLRSKKKKQEAKEKKKQYEHEFLLWLTWKEAAKWGWTD